MLSSEVSWDRPSADELTAADRELSAAPPQDVLRWAVGRFPGRLLMATAFGAEGCCLIHMLAEVGRETTLINLDTGYQFPETLALRDRLRERYGLTVELVQPDLSVADYEAEHGGPLHVHRPDQCCHDRKVLPLQRALARHAPEAWISAVRRDQTDNRATHRPRRPVGPQVPAWRRSTRCSTGRRRTCGSSSRLMTCRTTRCTTRATRASAAGRVPGRSSRARTTGLAAGPARSRRSAASMWWKSKTGRAFKC